MTTPSFPDAVRRLARQLTGQVPRLALALATRIRAEVPAYQDDRLVSFADLVAECEANLVQGLRDVDSPSWNGTDAARVLGRRRAEQGFPVEATLRSYRIGGQFMWETFVSAAGPDLGDQRAVLAAATTLWTFIDTYSAALAEGHRLASEDRARTDTEVRSALLEALFTGKSAAGRSLLDCAADLRLPAGGRFLVVVADTHALPRIEERLRLRGTISVWRQEIDAQAGIVLLSPSGSPEQLCLQLAGHTRARVGVSAEYHQIEATPAARHAAGLARAAVGPHGPGVLRHDRAPVPILLASAPEAARAVAQAALGPVLELPARDRELLLSTLRVWLGHDGATSAAAAELHCHRNTVRYRLRRLEDLTGLSLTSPKALSELHLALEALRLLPQHDTPAERVGS
ncbi:MULTISPECIES: helix-turn-helix domain-containing protein [unclassified Crossiella]|uniref:PucR family transcriptional regulator n=1 Tax=unclassified Crossiella TaxID=2620835 RepID=UPI001FFE9DB1|nr:MULTISPECIES: helix-turn-helix domain-containing protein [unclassified Crossiella]MCK2241263.1 helix-turn-helix domain-containing protein [Crossiella sp. S99.2]MCK2253593.1 helix-turn-helix domain-containing protein [Crossiella sp. S99.1]